MKKYKYGENSQLPQVLTILIVSLAGMSYGMLYSWTSPGIPAVVADESLNITLEEASYFVIIPQITMILTAPIYSVLLNVLGRKRTALLIAIPQLLSWIILGVSNNIFGFYAARFVGGIGDSGVLTVVPLYICEISEPSVRGSWGNAFAFIVAFGKFGVVLIGAFTTTLVTAMIGVGLVLLYIVLAAFIPESPYYLLMKNKECEASKCVSLLRWRCDIDEELAQLKADVARQVSETGTYIDLFKIDTNRRAFIIVVGLRIAQHYSGLVAFETYTQYMFQQAGSHIAGSTSAIIFTFLTLPALCIFVPLSNRIGRRKFTIFSSMGCAVSLLIVTVYFGFQQFSDVSLDNFTWIPLTGMLMYIVALCSGLAFMPFIVAGEMFSASIKAKATGVLTIVMGINTIIVSKLFQTLTHNFGIFTPFVFFSCCTVLSTIFCYVYVIETKGKTLEEIQQILKGTNIKQQGS